ncbi:MAG: hypothetical protein D6760_03905 [Deltaproteobacteria bacterium]|nr:MAG: hypothetical protein D6760_03905 [Deltaproteobacteria bacterium]
MLVASGALMAVLAVVFFALPVVGGHLIDQMYGYSYERLMSVLADYGERGRHVHLLATPTVDLLFPLAYVTFFGGAIRRLAGPASALALVPVVLGAVDLGENLHIIAMLSLYPDVPRALVASASCFTVVKHGLTLLTLLVLARSAWTRYRS